MNMLHGQTGFGGGSSFSVSRNQKAKLAADYQELLKELSTPKIHSIGNYILGEDLGEGTYGKVKFATHRLTGQRVAIKIIPKTHAENLTREIHHHRHLHHPNIISLFEVIPTETTIYMVLEYCEGGELYDYLVRAGGRLKENLARKMFGQLCRAVKYCHDRRVVHRDLKLENILLDSQKNIKLGDFGFTRECEVKKLLETICGSTGYSAPEMLAGKKYSGPEADIWSLGVILYTLLCGALPFDDEDDAIMRLKIMKCEYEFEEIVSDEAKDLIGSILKKNPTERPTLKQILQHTWFTIKDHEDEDDDDQWDTSEDVGDDDSISSIEEVSDKGKKSDNRSATLIQFNYQNAVNHLERQRQELLTATKQSTDSIHLQTFTPHVNHVNNSSGKKSVPSAYKRFNDIQQQPMASSSSRILGPSTSSKASRRSSIDSKAFNEKVFFTTSEEKELLEKLESLGFNITEIKRSVLEGKCDSSSGLWWLLLNKMREKMKNENWHNAITMVDVAVGTSDEEIETPEEFEEEEESEMVVIETPETDSGRPSQESEDGKMVKIPKITQDILPPTPPPKTYHAAPASRERRKSLILSVPEAVEPVLTTITATASPPLSPKKYAGFTSPISSRSVSPIPTSPIPLSIPNTKASHRKKLGLFSTIRGWWGGGSSHHPKDSGGGYKKSGLNWPDNGAVVPSDYARTSARPRANRKSGSRTPPNYDGNSDRRSSSISRNSVRDKKKKRNSLQGTKGRRSNQLSPLKIPPVTPSVVLSQNSPISMSPIPGTPPAKSRPIFTINRRKPFAYPTSSWGRKTVKRQSNGSLINILVDDFDEGSGSSDQNNTNNININDNSHQDPKDTFEKSAIENFSDDLQTTADKSKIDEQSKIIVESSKSKTITIASPTTPPFSLSSPLSNNKETEKLTKSLLIPLSTPQPSIEESTKVDASSSRIGITEVSSDGEDDSDVFVDANDFASYAQVRSRSPSPSLSNSPCDASPVFESDGALLNPPSFLIRSSPIKISSTRLSTTPSIPFSPPLSPIDGGSESMTNMPITRGQAMIEGLRSNKGKKPEAAATATVSPVDKTLSKSAFDLLSTPPDSPKLPPPRPSSPSSSKPAIPRLRHSKKASYPTPTSDFNVVGSDKNSKVTNNGLDIHDPQKENDQGGSSPPQSGPSINPSQRLFDLNNPNGRLAPRRPNNTKREASGINNPSNGLGSGRRPSLAKRPHGAIIEEEEEEEENEDMED